MIYIMVKMRNGGISLLSIEYDMLRKRATNLIELHILVLTGRVIYHNILHGHYIKKLQEYLTHEGLDDQCCCIRVVLHCFCESARALYINLDDIHMIPPGVPHNKKLLLPVPMRRNDLLLSTYTTEYLYKRTIDMPDKCQIRGKVR